MVRDVAIFRASQSRPSALTICTHYLTHSREQMSVISPVILSDTFAGTFLFKMELSIPLLFIFLNAPPFPSLLFSIHFSFCLTRFFPVYLWTGFFKMYLSIPFEDQHPPSPHQAWGLILHLFCVSLKKKREVSHFFFHSSLR